MDGWIDRSMDRSLERGREGGREGKTEGRTEGGKQVDRQRGRDVAREGEWERGKEDGTMVNGAGIMPSSILGLGPFFVDSANHNDESAPCGNRVCGNCCGNRNT